LATLRAASQVCDRYYLIPLYLKMYKIWTASTSFCSDVLSLHLDTAHQADMKWLTGQAWMPTTDILTTIDRQLVLFILLSYYPATSPDMTPPHTSTFLDSHSHEFKPPGLNASRSPCPALNALANHGYMYVPPFIRSCTLLVGRELTFAEC
jgi:hypothetical protein